MEQDDRSMTEGADQNRRESTATDLPPSASASYPEGVTTDPMTESRPAAIRRSSTTPIRHTDFADFAGLNDSRAGATRRRGHSVSANELHATPANRRRKDEKMQDIPEEGGALKQPPDFNSSRASRSLSGARMRKNESTSRPRGFTVTRRPTVLSNAPPSVFSLAGPAEPAGQTHQPYVDPGYSELNPAYEQPQNARPVWGLAKPLPRVVRPGMVPTPGELTPADGNGRPGAENPVDPDIEKGRFEPTLKLGKISTHLRDAREQRESNFLQRKGTWASASSPASPISPSIFRTSGDRRRQGSVTESGPPPLTPPSEFPELEDAGQALPAKDSTAVHSGLAEGDDNEAVAHERRYPDEVSDAETEIDDGMELYGDELGLKSYGTIEEVHNYHTHWSVIRTQFREPLAELLAVIVQLTLGFCADLAQTTSNNASGNTGSTNLAWGLATMFGIYIAGGISGAHLNPAISIMLWIYRGFPLRKVPSYVLAQVLGAFIAALISYGTYRRDILAYGGSDLSTGGTVNAFLTGPRYTYIDASTAFFTEFVATAILAIVVLALGDDTNAPPGAGMSAFVLGLAITVESTAFSNNTGCAMNPSRDFGPRLALLAVGYGRDVFQNGWWLYGPWAATISGAIVGAALYDIAIFVGGESPINYPRTRIKRAHVKWRRKWARRLKIDKGERNDIQKM